MIRSRARLLLPTCFLFVALAATSPSFAGDSTETSGDILRVGIPAAALALAFYEDDKEGQWQFYKSFGATVASTLVLKEVIDRDRPNGSGDDAFPSGHASMAFQGASFIHRRYGWKKAWPAWVLAGYTGWTRIDADEHDEVDVLAGAALGVAATLIFVDRMPNTQIALRLDNQLGIQFSGRFE